MADGYQKQLEAADDVQQRSLALLDRQEELLRRAELLVERLEKQRDALAGRPARFSSNL